MNNLYKSFEKHYGKVKIQTKLRQSSLYTFLSPYAKHRIDKVSELIIGQNLNVLEIGCGDGTFLYKLKYKWRKITGIDVVSERIKEARKKKFNVPTSFILKDFGRKPMPFPDNTFDLVVSISTLQYIYDLDLLFDEIKRVLNRRGKFIFEIPNFAVFWRRLEFLFGSLPRTSQFIDGWDAGIIHYFTQKDMAEFLKRHGFIIRRISCSGIGHTVRQIWPSVLGADLIFIVEKDI